MQQQFAVAIAAEFRAIADYNTSLAIFEFAKGTMQQYNNVTIGEGPLPPWVCKKAADHIRERTSAALQLRERDQQPPPGGPAAVGGTSVGPPTGTGLFDSLPPFAEKRPPVPESLPEMKPTDPKSVPPKPMPTIDGKVGAGGPGPLDYFVPIGTANAPPRKTPTITSTAPATLPQFPAPLGTAIQPAASAPAASPLGSAAGDPDTSRIAIPGWKPLIKV